MREHPTPAELQAFLSGSLPLGRTRSVVAHFLKGCDPCSAALEPQFRTLMGDLDAVEELDDAVYDSAFNRAYRAVFSNLDDRAIYDDLLRRSWELRFDDPGQMVELAAQALTTAERLRPEVYGAREVMDLQCRAWAELGNAQRVGNDLDQAETALGRAVEIFLLGTGDELLGARLYDVLASLHGARRNFDLALSSLDVVHTIHQRRGDHHAAGRARVSQGIYTGDQGDPEKAVHLIQQGLAMIDETRDPVLAFVAVHNLLWNLVECRRYQEARDLVSFRGHNLYASSGRINRLKMLWLEGRIDAGLGKLKTAERLLATARDGFEEQGLGFSAALTSLDLGIVWLQQGKAAETGNLILKVVGVFQALKIRREMRAAVLLLQRAFEKGAATEALLRSVSDYLRRADRNPALEMAA